MFIQLRGFDGRLSLVNVNHIMRVSMALDHSTKQESGALVWLSREFVEPGFESTDYLRCKEKYNDVLQLIEQSAREHVVKGNTSATAAGSSA